MVKPKPQPKTVSKTLTIRSADSRKQITVVVTVEESLEPPVDLHYNSTYAETRMLKQELDVRQRQHQVAANAHGLCSKIMHEVAVNQNMSISRMKVSE